MTLLYALFQTRNDLLSDSCQRRLVDIGIVLCYIPVAVI